MTLTLRIKQAVLKDTKLMKLEYVSQNPEIVKLSNSLPNKNKRLPAVDRPSNKPIQKDLDQIEELEIQSGPDLNDSSAINTITKTNKLNIPSINNMHQQQTSALGLSQAANTREDRQQTDSELQAEALEWSEKAINLPRPAVASDSRLISGMTTGKSRGLASASTKVDSLGMRKVRAVPGSGNLPRNPAS